MLGLFSCSTEEEIGANGEERQWQPVMGVVVTAGLGGSGEEIGGLRRNQRRRWLGENPWAKTAGDKNQGRMNSESQRGQHYCSSQRMNSVRVNVTVYVEVF
ncbi:hypothetical protein Droror1_Dr00014733 [Drosera rotundifolia]